MTDIQGKHVNLSVDEPELLCQFAHALASPVRVKILQALGKRSMNVGELAQELDIPMSSAALAVKVLEEAGLVRSESQPGARGSMKICNRKVDTLSVDLVPREESGDSVLVMQMPIGGYSSADGIRPTCGLAGEQTYIGDMDNPNSFYMPARFGAQLIWFRQGALEYRFAFPYVRDIVYDWLEISFEACSEAPMYRDPWKSDIAVSVNGKRLGIWTCPCDCGGRRGKQTPDWWSELSTQFGFLKTWRVDSEGSYLENTRVGDVCMKDLALDAQGYISVVIEVPEDAEHVGGINLFGEHFGDYTQPIILRIGYHLRDNQTERTEKF